MNNEVYAATGDGYLHAYDQDGNEVWNFDTEGTVIRASPVIAQDGTIYIGSDNRLLAISSDSGGLAQSAWPMFARDPRNTNSYAGPDPDNDGISQRDEDVNHNRVIESNETDPYNIDSDGDGIQDGTELGVTLETCSWATDKTIFQPDLDPSTTTSALLADTDGDGLSDGEEDLNHNGRIDPGETDPLNADPDGDNDGITDSVDSCDGDDASGDSDGDGICDDKDNCSTVANADQVDTNSDGTGDACTFITDGDLAPYGNPDGVVNVGDALVCLRFALGLETPTAEDILHADVAPLGADGRPNPDGIINVADALVILRKAVGLIDFSGTLAGGVEGN